jgi:hypothetical protein
MKFVLTFFSLFIVVSAVSQTKKDGTPDMRFKANKGVYPTYSVPKTKQPRNYNNNGGYILKNGYIKSNGTYVEPHYQTAPNNTKLDNFSTEGNVNPFTGKEGRVDPHGLPSNAYPTPVQPLPRTQTEYTPIPIYTPSYSAVANQCLGITQKGTQCRRMTKSASGYCYQHE